MVTPGSSQKARVIAEDPDGDPLTVRWEVRSESMDRREGGDREAEPPPHPELFVEARGMDFAFKAPTLDLSLPGFFFFVFVYDGRGNAATANVPFLVKRASKVEPGTEATLEPWRVVGSRISFEDRWLKVRTDRCVDRSGRIIDPYHVLEFPSWINVVPVTKDRAEIVLGPRISPSGGRDRHRSPLRGDGPRRIAPRGRRPS